jgi:hypothetical protein
VLVNTQLVGIAAADGRVLWQHDRANSRYGGTYTPIVQESRIFSANGYGGGLALFNLTRQGDGLVARQKRAPVLALFALQPRACNQPPDFL